jgi:hypothetical protein
MGSNDSLGTGVNSPPGGSGAAEAAVLKANMASMPAANFKDHIVVAPSGWIAPG